MNWQELSFTSPYQTAMTQRLMTLVALCASLTTIAICEKIGLVQRNDRCAIKKNTHT